MIAPESDLLVARAVILWPWRVKNGVVRLDDPDRGKGLRREFVRHIRADFSLQTRKTDATDLEQVFREFVRRRPALKDWYQAIFDALRLKIDWNTGGPIVAISSFAAWTALANEFDADALLAFDLAARHIDRDLPDETIGRLSGWLTCARASDTELDALFAKGMSDMHVHAGGVRLPQAAWLELMQSARAPIAYTSLPECYRDINREFDADLATARAARVWLAKELGYGAAEPLPQPSTERWWSWHHSNLAHERALLLGAWSRVVDAPSSSVGLAMQLDLYLDQKHRFFSRVREPAFDAVPGLQYFTEWHFRALERKPGRSKWKGGGAQYGSSRRLAMAPFGDACQYLLESRHLERIELRMGPLERAPDYWRFFKHWNTLKSEIDKLLRVEGRPPVDIRFAVHFKRSRSRSTRRDLTNTLARLSELDRHTAVLRVALACPARGSLLAPLQRVDVAGHERDTSISLFAWHLRLLRGDRAAIKMLEQDAFPPPWSAKTSAWRRLRLRELERPPRHQLGLTLHVGEDFADPLDGLFEIGTAMDVCGLSSGDGIGHGLVLAPPSEHARERGFTMIPRGEAIDQLCWLHDTLKKSHPGDFPILQLRLHRPIEDLAAMLYKDVPDVAREVKVEDLLWLWRLKSGSETDWRLDRAGDRLPRRLLELENDERFIEERDLFISLPERRELDDIVKQVRELLLRQVIDRRIVVEMNPSSNLSISGAESTSVNPAVMLIQAMKDGLLACINTDNPGVFMSCVENEFALLLDGLNSRKLSKHDISTWLERAREIGRTVLK